MNQYEPCCALDRISASRTAGLEPEDGSRVETLLGEVNGVSSGGGTIMSMSGGSLGLRETLAEIDFAMAFKLKVFVATQTKKQEKRW